MSCFQRSILVFRSKTVLSELTAPNDSEMKIFSAEPFLTVFRNGGKQNIRGRVDHCLHGVLNNTNYETDTDDLHGNVSGDPKQRTSHRNQKKRTAGDTGSTRSAKCCHDAEQYGNRQKHMDPLRVCSCKGHYCTENCQE